MVIVEFMTYPYVDIEFEVGFSVNPFGVIVIPGTTDPLMCYVCNDPIVYIHKTISPITRDDGTPSRRTSRQPVTRLLANHCFVLQHINCSCPQHIYDDGDSSDSGVEGDPPRQSDDDVEDIDDTDEDSSGCEATDVDEDADDIEMAEIDIGDFI